MIVERKIPGGFIMDSQYYLNMFRQVKVVSAATVDEAGFPQSRIINVMLAVEEGLCIVTSRGKPFHRQLAATGRIALSASVPVNQSLKLCGKLKPAGREWVDRVFAENPGMNEVYPGKSRYALDAFLIHEGYGEWFDLSCRPIRRELFAFGGAEPEKSGFEIAPDCTGCGACAAACPQQCIDAGTPFQIRRENCLLCGLCAETCPAGAVRRLHP